MESEAFFFQSFALGYEITSRRIQFWTFVVLNFGSGLDAFVGYMYRVVSVISSIFVKCFRNSSYCTWFLAVLNSVCPLIWSTCM